MAENNLRTGSNRRSFLGIGALLALAGVGRPRNATAHALPAGSFGSPALDAALAVTSGYRAVFQSANIEASARFGDTLEHLLLGQANNWLNGFQFSYKVAPQELHVVVAVYSSANPLTYNDTVWRK
jgi:hypothetical protein